MQYSKVALAVLACLVCAPAAHAQIIASDNFDIPPYAVGNLAGQAVGGTGFTGNWAQIPTLDQDLSVVSPGVIGRPVVAGGNSGDFALFAGGGHTVTSGQFFISYDINNPKNTNLNSSRLDLRTSSNTVATLLGASGALANFNFSTNGFGSAATAQTNIASTGAHHLVGVLDSTNHQIAIFVDPTAASFYNSTGANDADATAVWTPPASYTATGYNLVDNLADQASFDNVVFALDAGSVGVGPAAVPEPGGIALLVGMGMTGAAFLRRRKQTNKAA